MAEDSLDYISLILEEIGMRGKVVLSVLAVALVMVAGWLLWPRRGDALGQPQGVEGSEGRRAVLNGGSRGESAQDRERTVRAKPVQSEWSDPDGERPRLNQGLLTELVATPQKDPRGLTEQIFLAAAEKDASFRRLLDREDLRSEAQVSVALDVYDYAINGNQAALEKILALHQAEGAGDSLTYWAISYIDEWDLTLKAVAAQRAPANDASYVFWRTRAQQFPEHYRKFKRDSAENSSR